MFNPPNSFASGTSHRVVHFLDQQIHTHHDRAEDILADAARCVRGAIEALDEIPFSGVDFWRHDLIQQTGTCRFLNDEFRIAARRALRALAQQVPEQAPEAHDRASRLLRDALEHSHRVTELLAAEREIAEFRNQDI